MKLLLDTKQLIHIGAELVIILAVIFYFSQRNKKVMRHINDLVQRIEEQEDTIQKHEQTIKDIQDKMLVLTKLVENNTKTDKLKPTAVKPNNVKPNNVKPNNVKPSNVKPKASTPIERPELSAEKMFNMMNSNIRSPIIVREVIRQKQPEPEPEYEKSKVEEIIDDEEDNIINEDEDDDEELDNELKEELEELADINDLE